MGHGNFLNSTGRHIYFLKPTCDISTPHLGPLLSRCVPKKNGNIHVYIIEAHWHHALLQCSKLKVHSAPGAQISKAGRTFFAHVHMFFHPIVIAIYQRSAQKNSRVHSFKMNAPDGIQNKRLISNTVYSYVLVAERIGF